MRTVKLHHPQGHPYWQAGEFKVQLPNGNFYHDDTPSYFGFKIEIKPNGIYKELYGCGSGYGKKRLENKEPILIISKNDYDNIEYVGKELEMNKDLQQDLIENGLDK